MHYMKEYIDNYNKSKNLINIMLIEIEECLDKLFEVKKIEDIKQCREFLENVLKVNSEAIEVRIKSIVRELNKLQSFCYDDIKNIIPFISELKELDEHEAFIKAKDINYVIDCIEKSNDKNKVFEKRILLDIAEFNKKVRYFIHTTLAVAENPSPLVIVKKIKKNIKEKYMKHTSEDLVFDLSYIMSEVYRIRKNLDQFHILTNNEYGDWKSKDIKLIDIIEYFKIYKNRFSDFYFNKKIYHIETLIRCTLPKNIELSIPLDKLKEILDVLLHNAADELVEKSELEGDFEKRIICEIEELEEKILISITDNGRGFKDEDEVEKAFFSSKILKLNSQGIGLDIAKNNIHMMGGVLEKENLFNGGACFKVLIPKKVKVRTETFGVKINIAVFGEVKSEINAELLKLKDEYKEHRIIYINNENELKSYLQNASINAIDVIVQSKSVNLLNSFMAKNFKGRLITV